MAGVPLHDETIEQRRRSERSLWRRALAASFLLHLFVVLGWPEGGVVRSPFAAAGPRAGDAQAASGEMQAINLQMVEVPPLRVPRVPVISLDAVRPVEFDDLSELEPTEFAGGAPGVETPGVSGGAGAGDGGANDEGNFRVVAPVPRGMIWPPESSRLESLDLEVWVFVDAEGRVVPDSTWLRPPTEDRGFNERLIEDAADWVFEPGQRAGQPVATWFLYRITR